MTKQKPPYTSPPWQVLSSEDDVPYLRIRGTVPGRRYKIANVHNPQVNLESHPAWAVRERNESESNAKLIAAAPELLEALEGLMSIGLRPSDITPEVLVKIKKAKSAIAKAKGEGN